MSDLLNRFHPAVRSAWVMVQHRLPSILLTLNSLELTVVMILGMCISAANRRRARQRNEDCGTTMLFT
jgi:hypothetical protein